MLASPGYVPGTIAVNVTWMKTGFNAYQKHRSIPIYLQPFSSYIVRYWSEIATFSYHLAFNTLVEGDPLEAWTTVAVLGFSFWGATGVATLSSGGHTTNTVALNYRVCNRLYQIIHIILVSGALS